MTEKLLKAYADKTRLRIIGLLLHKKAKGGFCVCQIQSALNMKQAAVSKAMNVLKNAGIVTNTKKGLWVYYALTNSGLSAKINRLISEYGVNEVKIAGIMPPEKCCSLNKKRC